MWSLLMGALPLIAVAGMVSEAKIIARSGVTAVIGGGRSEQLTERLERRLQQGASGVISFGLCGGLDPALKVGDVLVASAVDNMPTDAAWASALVNKIPGARLAKLTAGDVVVPDAASKAALRDRTGAAGVDMESHIAARLAANHGVPFAALRAVSDDARNALPGAAQAGLGADGKPDIAAVLRSLALDPRQLPALIRTGRDARTALDRLVDAVGRLSGGSGDLIGPGVGGLDLGEHLIDVA